MLALTLLRASFVSASVSETRFHPGRMLQLRAVETIHTALGMKHVKQQLEPLVARKRKYFAKLEL